MEELGKITVAGMNFSLRTFHSESDRQFVRINNKCEPGEVIIDNGDMTITLEKKNFAQNLAAAYDRIWERKANLKRIENVNQSES